MTEKQREAFQSYAHNMQDPVFRKQQESEERNRHMGERFDSHAYHFWVVGVLIVVVNLAEHYKWPTWPIATFWVFLLLVPVEAIFWVRFRQVSWLAASLLSVALLVSGLSSFTLYGRIQERFSDSEHWVVAPEITEDSISETGYIYDVTTWLDFYSEERKITWSVKIPKTNTVYECEWQSGYVGFAKDDEIRLIHKLPDAGPDDRSGFIVGIYGAQNGRSASVRPFLVRNPKF